LLCLSLCSSSCFYLLLKLCSPILQLLSCIPGSPSATKP
jgi:hypothetical protein